MGPAQALLPEAKPGGRHREADLRDVLTAVYYFFKCGIPWRYVPHDLPPWGTVHFDCRQGRLGGTWSGSASLAFAPAFASAAKFTVSGTVAAERLGTTTPSRATPQVID